MSVRFSEVVGYAPTYHGFGDYFKLGALNVLASSATSRPSQSSLAERPIDHNAEARHKRALASRKTRRCPDCGALIFASNAYGQNPNASGLKRKKDRSLSPIVGCVRCITDRATDGGRSKLPEAPEVFS